MKETKLFTEEEIQFLKDHYLNMKPTEMAQALTGQSRIIYIKDT